jgi:hypothetical protein
MGFSFRCLNTHFYVARYKQSIVDNLPLLALASLLFNAVRVNSGSSRRLPLASAAFSYASRSIIFPAGQLLSCVQYCLIYYLSVSSSFCVLYDLYDRILHFNYSL